MGGQHRGDLAGLHPEPADLDLLISAPGEHQLPVPPASQVPGPVHPAPGRAERARHKPLRGQPRTIQVTPRQTRPRHIQFPRHPVRHQPQPAIKHEHPGVIHRTPDRHRLRPRPRHRIARGERRGLGRPVHMDHRRTRALRQHPGHRLPGLLLPAGPHLRRRARHPGATAATRSNNAVVTNSPVTGSAATTAARPATSSSSGGASHRRPPGQQRHPQLISHRIKDLRRMHHTRS